MASIIKTRWMDAADLLSQKSSGSQKTTHSHTVRTRTFPSSPSTFSSVLWNNLTTSDSLLRVGLYCLNCVTAFFFLLRLGPFYFLVISAFSSSACVCFLPVCIIPILTFLQCVVACQSSNAQLLHPQLDADAHTRVLVCVCVCERDAQVIRGDRRVWTTWARLRRGVVPINRQTFPSFSPDREH